MKLKKWVCVLLAVFLLAGLFCMPALAAADDVADAVERLVLVMISQLDIVAIQTDVDAVRLTPVELLTAGDIGVDFFLRTGAAGYVDSAHCKDSFPYLVDDGIIIPPNTEV